MAPLPRPPRDLNAELARALAEGGGGQELVQLLALIARRSLWPLPEFVRRVGAVFPRTARIRYGREKQGEFRGPVRLWSTQPPKEALLTALGIAERDLTDFTVCHIHPGSAQNPRHFTHLGNLAIVPSALSAFTDWNVVAAVLQRRSFERSGYRGPSRHAPPIPPGYPRRWPAAVAPHDRSAVLKDLFRAKAERPTWTRLARPPAPPSVAPAARSLNAEFWAQEGAIAAPMFARWLVRHAYFAPPRIVAQVPNPFPRCRRIHFNAHERARDFKGGVFLATNTAAADALLVAIGERLRATLGGAVDHPWPEAPYLPPHFCHLGGLVLVPGALASIVDAPPLRAVLRRRLFERTGYAGPSGQEPPRPALMPAQWPENIALSEDAEARALRMLIRYRRDRPGYYTRPRSAARRSKAARVRARKERRSSTR